MTNDNEDRSLEEPRRRIHPAFIIVGVVLLSLPVVLDGIALRRTAELIVLSLGVLGVVVATGYTGLISLGHGVFVGIGAFAMASYMDLLGLPIPVAFVVTFATCSVVGFLLGVPALRIRGIYLALLTFGLALMFPALAKRFPSITGGVSGRPVETELTAPSWFDPPAIGQLGTDNDIVWQYLVSVFVCGLLFWMTAGVLRGRTGRAMQATRDSEAAAASFGVHLVRTKAGAFGLSAGLAGTAGALQTLLWPFVSQEDYTVGLSFRLYAAALLGGVSVMVGAVYGVAALVLIPAINGALGLLDNDVLVFAIGLIVLTFVSPDGMAGLVSRNRERLQGRRWWGNVKRRYSG